MYELIRGISVSLLTCIIFTVLHCGPQQVTGVGTGSETVIGHLVHNDGTPASGTIVTLHPADFDPVSGGKKSVIATDTTDKNGSYEITLNSPKTNVYTLQANNLAKRTRVIISDIDISAPGDSTLVDVASLNKTGSIRVILSDSLAGNGYVFIPGTGYYSYVENGYAVLDSVPAQIIPGIFYEDTSNEDMSGRMAENIDVQPEITTIVTSSGPLYARKVYLNTTSSGAGVDGTVTDFPVLIRLNADNFNFIQAKTDGSDLSFRGADEKVIPHEIERWDPNGQKAEIWVLVDTVYGNNSTQYISMYWGDPEAAGSSNSSAVFDTAAGYRGVWHLGDDGKSILDATANKHNGSKNGNQAVADGNIGFAQSFDGEEDYTDIGDVCNPGMSSFTVSAWIKKHGSGKIQAIVSKTTGALPNKSYGWLFQLDGDGALAIFLASDSGVWGDPGSFVLTSKDSIKDSSWHHVAAVVDRSSRDNCRIYIDGEDVGTYPTGGDIAFVGSIVNSLPLRFGAEGDDDCQWEGVLDEISIIFRVKSQDYIKLCYMNQKRDDALVVFK